jgi:hypothetical protein
MNKIELGMAKLALLVKASLDTPALIQQYWGGGGTVLADLSGSPCQNHGTLPSGLPETPATFGFAQGSG